MNRDAAVSANKMKTLINLVAAVSILACASSMHGQGTISFDNLANNNPSMSASSGGLVFLQVADGVRPLNQDLNFELLAGVKPLGVMTSLDKWLLSDSSAKGISVGGGHFADPSRSVFVVPGVPPYGNAWLELDVWVGMYNSLNAALVNGGLGVSVYFWNPTGASGQVADLTGMPAVVLAIPEPSMLSFVVTGAIAFLLLRRRSWRQNEEGRERASS